MVPEAAVAAESHGVSSSRVADGATEARQRQGSACEGYGEALTEDASLEGLTAPVEQPPQV